jgi:hypothetical protein
MAGQSSRKHRVTVATLTEMQPRDRRLILFGETVVLVAGEVQYVPACPRAIKRTAQLRRAEVCPSSSVSPYLKMLFGIMAWTPLVPSTA